MALNISLYPPFICLSPLSGTGIGLSVPNDFVFASVYKINLATMVTYLGAHVAIEQTKTRLITIDTGAQFYLVDENDLFFQENV